MDKQSYVIITDSDGEIPLQIVDKYNLPYVPMPYILDNKEYFYDLGRNTDFKEFYSLVRAGHLPSTYTYPPEYYVEMWTPYLMDGQDILFISFSSKLSSAYGFVCTAAQTLREEYPERVIRTIDTLTISGGMALLVNRALENRASGMQIEDNASDVEAHLQNSMALFTVDDLNHLRRGGRLSATGAIMGNMLKVKPMLHLSEDGCIKVFSKVMGRQKSIHELAQLVIDNAVDPQDNILIVLHGDAEEDAKRLLALVTEKLTFKDVMFQYVGPVIGSHTGCGALGICFMGKGRMA